MIRPATLACLLLSLLLCGCSGAPPSLFGTWQPNIKAAPDIAPMEREMFARLNKDRAGQSLAPLQYDERLADVGRAHSHDMREHDFFSHQSPNTGVLEDRMDRAGYLAFEMRENLATAANVQKAEDNLLGSARHRANIMATSVTHVGIGIVRGDGDGDKRVLTVTQVFARPAQLDTPEKTKGLIRTAIDSARRDRKLPPLKDHPMLSELAKRHLGDLPDGLPDDAVSEVGDHVSEALNDRDGHGLVAIQIVAQAIFNAGEFPMPASALTAKTAHVGLATGTTRDERGRPRVKVLVLLGQVGRK